MLMGHKSKITEPIIKKCEQNFEDVKMLLLSITTVTITLNNNNTKRIT